MTIMNKLPVECSHDNISRFNNHSYYISDANSGQQYAMKVDPSSWSFPRLGLGGGRSSVVVDNDDDDIQATM